MIPFIIKKTLINNIYDDDSNELDLIVASYITNKNITKSNISFNLLNNKEYTIEFLINNEKCVLIDKILFKDSIKYFIEGEYKYLSNNLLLYLIKNENILKHTEYDFWYISKMNYYDSLSVVNKFFKQNKNIHGLYKTEKIYELIKVLECKIIQEIKNIIFIEINDINNFNYCLEKIEDGEIPETLSEINIKNILPLDSIIIKEKKYKEIRLVNQTIKVNMDFDEKMWFLGKYLTDWDKYYIKKTNEMPFINKLNGYNISN